MLATPHVVTGLIIGSISPNPAIAFGGGVLSHLITDAIPHLDSRSFRDKSTSKELWLSDIIIAGIDSLIAIGIIIYAATHGAGPAMLLGAIGAWFPDLIEAPFFLFFRERYRWLHKLSTWHGRAHFDRTKFQKSPWWAYAGIWSQIFVLMFALAYFQKVPITKAQEITRNEHIQQQQEIVKPPPN